MNWGTGTLFGIDTVIAFEGDAICGLYFCKSASELLLDFGLTDAHKAADKGVELLYKIESGDDVKIKFIKASELERAVWSALLNIAPAKTATYSDIAAATGRPTAVRAVASAIGRNPISFIVPCHRILRRDGSLGGYRWGLDVKRALLARERVK